MSSRRVSLPLLLGVSLGAFTTGCGGNREPSPDGAPLFDPSELPQSLSELGIYPDPSDLETAHPDLVRFQPRYALWSNGGEKDRLLHLPRAESIDNSDPEYWEFPDGSVFFKTFSFEDEDGRLRPVETRLLVKLEGTWDYALYLWDETATDAELTDLKQSTPVQVYEDGEAFEHVVPSRLDCRKCHESQEQTVIGFDELRLAFAEDDGETQLQSLFDRGLLSSPPGDSQSIEHPDALTRDVLGYLHGNCAHCHNGGELASASFDMRHFSALDNLIDRPTESEGLSGIRIVPSDPEQSVLYRALVRDESDPELRPMPPVGVQRVDQAAAQMIFDWITNLE